MRLVMLADGYLLDPSTGINGAQVQMYNLAHAFARRGVEVHYVCLTGGSAMTQYHSGALTLHWIQPFEKRGAGFSWLRYRKSFQNALQQIAPDAVYQRGRSFLTYVAAKWAKRTGKLFVWGTNGEDSTEFWKMTGNLYRSRRPAWKKAFLTPAMFTHDLMIHRGVRMASKVVNQTEFQRKRLLNNYGKIGVVLPSYTLPPSGKSGIDKEKIVLWLSTLSSFYQPELFLNLAERCLDLDGWTFVLAGGTPDRDYEHDVETRAQNITNVRVLGAVPYAETETLYERAALYVRTCKNDGISNAFIQAWLRRTPVLSLNVDPNGWIEEKGLGFFARGDMNRLVEQAREYLIHYQPGNAMGKKCEDFAIATFASDKTIDSYIGIFSSGPASASADHPVSIMEETSA